MHWSQRLAAWVVAHGRRPQAVGGTNVSTILWIGLGVLVVTGIVAWWKTGGSPALNTVLSNFTSNL